MKNLKVQFNGSKKCGWLIELTGDLNKELYYEDVMVLTDDEARRLLKVMTRKLSTSKYNDKK